MGASMANRSLTVEEQTRSGGQLLMTLNKLEAMWEKILLTRQKDAGFRGGGTMDEPINAALPLPDCPELGTILAADGSQIYPDAHGLALYWLTNIGVFVYPHGGGGLPDCVTEPQLYFEDKDLRDPDGRIIANAAINARRAVYEMQMLAREALTRRDLVRPMITLYDGPLLVIGGARRISTTAEATHN